MAGDPGVVVIVIVFHGWRFIGSGIFDFGKICFVSRRHHAPGNLAGLWGVTLPEINGSGPDWPAGKNSEIGSWFSAQPLAMCGEDFAQNQVRGEKSDSRS
jgi:hypothetical protein